MSPLYRSVAASSPPSRTSRACAPSRGRKPVLVSLAFALLLALPCAASGQERVTDPKPGAAARGVSAGSTAPVQAGAHRGEGCSPASLAVLNDLVGSLTEDSFQPNPSIGGGGGTDPAGCGEPNRTRREDPGNPVGPTRATSSMTITGDFP